MRTLRHFLISWLAVLLSLGEPSGTAAEPVPSKHAGNPMTKKNTAAYFVEQELAKGKQPNRLITEQSPYLLQHAFNPVNWYPWGKEAFARAQAEDKPIFLSIGYSTCHWCHVMARESFEDPEIAALLNKYFVCIKVDREERPDVDQIYMAATQALSGGGGWPMSVFLTPGRKPFFAGTYFPTAPQHGLPSFKQVLVSIEDVWKGKRDKVMESAASVTEHLRNASPEPAGTAVDEAMSAKAYRLLASDFDAINGGFGGAPKFPRPVVFNLLLRHYQRGGEQQALDMVLFTLRKMAAGGMYDHVGGGFHRYSVDNEWRVPHFEKMLYDQGQLANAYLEAFQITREPFYASVAADILDYVLRDMTSPEGAFFSAEDADSPDPKNPEKHGEGFFYLWSEKEIHELLGPKAGAIFACHYGVAKGGNALSDPHGEFAGKNILHVAKSLEETAGQFGKSVEAVAALLDDCRRRLFDARVHRPRPHLDDKVITAWNGHMISAFARGYQVLAEERYQIAAVRAARFLIAHLMERQTGTLLRRYRDGQAGLPGQLDDYAFFGQALLDLYAADFDVTWLQQAVALTEKQIALFHDEQGGGFFDVGAGDESILFRLKSDYDGAEPTGNSVAALNLLQLAQITDNQQWREMAVKTIEAFAGRIKEYPPVLPQLLVAHDFARQKPRQIIIAGQLTEEGTRRMLGAIRKRFLPGSIVLLADGGEGQEWLSRRLPFLADMKKIDNMPTAYVCQNFSCSRPTTDPAAFEKQLDIASAIVP